MNWKTIELDLASIRSMSEALNWSRRCIPPATFVNAIAQDEFTHDVVVRLSPETFVVFDTT